MPDKLLLLMLSHAVTGNQHTKRLLKTLAKKTGLSQEDLFGQLIDKHTHHQEVVILVSLLMPSESTEKIQEQLCHWIQSANLTRRMN